MAELKLKTVRPAGLPDLFHVSFKSKSWQGIWTPGNPAGSEEVEESAPGVVGDQSFPYPEPNLPRVSVGPSIEGCFRGVFPNVAQYFEKKNYPWAQFSVFQPQFTGRERVVLPGELTAKRFVWDACVTEEHCILDPVFMKFIGIIKVFNTNKSPTMFIHPFGDPKLPVESVGPANIKFEWITKS